ncbi:MAG TPA: isoprenylcysteine carboxylmethyltransferase family protein [Gaiellaceae bacterium]|nr:isoprenylcysteine carboxylmethyltransferase family protein [Gaiellaceae bacterium]
MSFLGPEIGGRTLTWLGLLIALGGVVLVVWARRAMGRSFSAFPTPRPGAELVVRGPYRFVRHPMYVGGILVLLGFSLAFSAVGLLLTAGLAVLWVFKARHEERLLEERFPGYAEYRRATRF